MRHEKTELKRAVAQLDTDLSASLLRLADCDARINSLVAENSRLYSALETAKGDLDRVSDELAASVASASELEGVLQAEERARDASDAESLELSADVERLYAELDSARAMCEQVLTEKIEDQRDRNSLWAENRRLRGVIVFYAANAAGLGLGE